LTSANDLASLHTTMKHRGSWSVIGVLVFGCAQQPASTPVTEAKTSTGTSSTEACDLALASEFRHPSEVVKAVAYARQTDATWKRTEGVLRRLASAGGKRFQYELKDLAESENRAAAREYGIDRTGIVLDYRGKRGAVLVETPTLGAVAHRVRHLVLEGSGKNIPVGVVGGKGGIELAGDLTPVLTTGQRPTLHSILAQAFPFYRFQTVMLTSGEPIDRTLSGLVITQPATSFTREELQRIDDFLLEGDKTVVVYASSASPKQHGGSLSMALDMHGLNELIAGYGVEMKKDVVLDFAAPIEFVILGTNGEKSALLYPPVSLTRSAHGTLDASFSPFLDLEELPFPFPSSLAIVKDRQPPDVLVRTVASSSKHARLETGDVVDLPLQRFGDWPRSGDEHQVPLAVAVEGRLKSAFSARRASKPSRLLVVSSGLFLANPFAHAGNSDAPTAASESQSRQQLVMLAGPYAKDHLTRVILSVKQTLDWMTLGDLRACK
jgi:hypothetical protein